MKKSFIIIIFLSFFSLEKASAQFINNTPGDLFLPNSGTYVSNKFPLSNFHFFNPYYFNPAMAGVENKKQLNANWNRQLDHSFLVSYEQPINTINSAIGMYVSHTSHFSRSIMSYGFAFNYGFNFKNDVQLKLGVQFSNVHFGLGRYYEDKKDWFAVPAIDLGTAFQIKQFRLGVSIQNLFPTQIVPPDNFLYFAENKSGERQLNISIANTFKLSEKWHWSLATLLRDTKSQDIHDFSSYISFRKKYIFGVTYRTEVDHQWIGFVGVKIKEKVNLQFSFNEEKDNYEDRRFFETLAQYQF